jgi:CRISPR/Cas system-associated exonuclease Cas4 (RecB family)
MTTDLDPMDEEGEEYDDFYISASRVGAFEWCPRSHDLRYNKGAPSQGNRWGRMGKLFHERVAESLENGTVPLLPRKWLDNYLEVLDTLKISDNIEVEHGMYGTLQGFPIFGIMDLIDHDRQIIVDWKFGKVKPFPVQAYFYHDILIQNLETPYQVYYAFLKHGVLRTIRPEELRVGETMFAKYLAAVTEDQEELPTFKPCRKCNMCGFKLSCVMEL